MQATERIRECKRQVAIVRPRRVVGIVLGLLSAAFALLLLFPRFRNDATCESSVPLNAAQTAGLADARARKTGVCSGAKQRCQFGIEADADGTFRVSVYFVEMDFFDGCVSKGQDSEVLVYSREGKFIRIEGAPFG